MTTYYAAFLRPGARWDPAKPVREQPFWDDHARFMDALFEKGAIVLGGPFADRTGSLDLHIKSVPGFVERLRLGIEDANCFEARSVDDLLRQSDKAPCFGR